MKLFFRKKNRQDTASCSVVVLAAGSSTRMGRDKIMLEVGGLPVIVRTLMTFESISEVNEVIVVTREALIPEIAGLCKIFDLKKVKKVVCGGASRSESARIGTMEADREAQLIAVHDAARPFADAELIRRTILKAAETGAAAPAVPVKDTIKVAHDGVVEYTPDRTTLFAVQTPQIFDAALIRAALQKAIDDGVEITDDCSAVERLGMKISLTAGDERNIKITTPNDVILANMMSQEVLE